MDKYILTTTDSIILVLFGSYATYSTYFMFDYYLKKYSGSYQKLNEEKQFYVLSNLIKSGLLFVYTPFSFITLTKIIITNPNKSNWQHQMTLIHNLGSMYIIPDFVSLFQVKRMQWNTWFHHICVVVFGMINISNRYDTDSVWNAIVVYAIFSTFSYAVNFLLASRFLGVSNWFRQTMSSISFAIYTICCFLNWIWQVNYLYYLSYLGFFWSILIYSFLITFMIYDDLVLLNWLRKQCLISWQKSD